MTQIARPGPATTTCHDREQFDRLWRTWTTTKPFPLLECPALVRYGAFLSDQAVTTLPRVDTAPRPGVVLSTGGTSAEAAGQLLARSSSRPCRHVAMDQLREEMERSRDEPIAIVGLFDDIAELEDWPGEWAPRVGVVTARDLASLVCLVYRILTVPALTASRDVLAVHPLDPAASNADAVSVTEMRELTLVPVRVLTARIHGGECSLNLPDGVICGRSADATDMPPPGLPRRALPACMRGPSPCFIPGLTPQQILPAEEVRGSVVFAQACGALAVGTNTLPGDFGVGMGFMSGTAVALFGPVGRSHVPPPSAQSRFDAALNDGMPLGDIVQLLNRLDSPSCVSMSRYGLLGDPTSTFGGRAGVVRAPVVPIEPVIPADDPLLRRLAYLTGTVVPRIARLRWLGLPVNERRLASLRHRVGPAALEPSSRAATESLVESLNDELSEIQAALVHHLIEEIHSTWWKFEQFLAFREQAAEPVTCPQCSIERATRIRLRHRLEPGLLLWTVQCRSCGDVSWTTDERDGPVVSGAHRNWVRTRSRGVITRTVENPADDGISGAVGFSMVNGNFRDFTSRWSEPCRIGPGQRTEQRWTFDTHSEKLIPDDYRAVFAAVLDGVFTLSPILVCVSGEGGTGEPQLGR